MDERILTIKDLLLDLELMSEQAGRLEALASFVKKDKIDEFEATRKNVNVKRDEARGLVNSLLDVIERSL